MPLVYESSGGGGSGTAVISGSTTYEYGALASVAAISSSQTIPVLDGITYKKATVGQLWSGINTTFFPTTVITSIGSLDTRILSLENKNVKAQWYYTITAGQTGTISVTAVTTIPSAVIDLDQWPAGVDALLSTIESGQITFEPPEDITGRHITTEFSGSGTYLFDGIPNTYPVALIFAYTCKLTDFNEAKALNDYEIDQVDGRIPDVSSVATVPSIWSDSTGGVLKVLISAGRTLTIKDDNSLSVSFTHADFGGGSKLIGVCPANLYIQSITLDITTLFNGGAQILCGDAGANGRFMAAVDNYPGLVGKYAVYPDYFYAAETNISLYFGGAPTTGAGTVIVYFN